MSSVNQNGAGVRRTIFRLLWANGHWM